MGLAVVGALNIASTFTNLFGVFFFSLGTAVAIVTGQTLGANEPEKARDQVWKLMFVSVAIATFMGDRKSTRLNSSHVRISYAVFCLKKKIDNIFGRVR